MKDLSKFKPFFVHPASSENQYTGSQTRYFLFPKKGMEPLNQKLKKRSLNGECQTQFITTLSNARAFPFTEWFLQTLPLWMGKSHTLDWIRRDRVRLHLTQLFLAQLGLTYATGIRHLSKVYLRAHQNKVSKYLLLHFFSLLLCCLSADHFWMTLLRNQLD